MTGRVYEQNADPLKTDPNWPMAPDMVHFRNAGCYIKKMVLETALNAQTNKEEISWYTWLVQPYVDYDDKRQHWEAETKTGRPEFIGDFKCKADDKDGNTKAEHDAFDICDNWMRAAEQLAISEKLKHGQTLQKKEKK